MVLVIRLSKSTASVHYRLVKCFLFSAPDLVDAWAQNVRDFTSFCPLVVKDKPQIVMVLPLLIH
jgi:hypothetical protein